MVEIIPPMSAGKYEAKVTMIYDQTNKKDVELTNEMTSLSWAQTSSEALKKAKKQAMRWANSQR